MDSTPGSGFSKQSGKFSLSSGYALRQLSVYHKNPAHVILPFVPAISFLGHLSEKNKTTSLKGPMHPNVLSIIIYNFQGMEAT